MKLQFLSASCDAIRCFVIPKTQLQALSITSYNLFATGFSGFE
jgi:hypothetical protein